MLELVEKQLMMSKSRSVCSASLKAVVSLGFFFQRAISSLICLWGKRFSDTSYNVNYWTVAVRDKHAQVKLMKNMNKPLPDGGVALPTSETGQKRGEEEKKYEIQIRTHLRPDNSQVITDTEDTV